MYWSLRKLFFRLTITILLLQTSQQSPIRKNDIIAGEDFLSIFISQEQQRTTTDSSDTLLLSTTTTKATTNKKNFNLPPLNLKPSSLIEVNSKREQILPIEKMFSSSNEELLGESTNNHYEIHEQIHTTRDKFNLELNRDDSKSKIDLEYDNFSNSSSDNKTQMGISDTKINDSIHESTKSDVKVIAVSISSSINQSQNSKPVELVETTTTIIKDKIIDNLDSKFISNSHKTEFSIDEIDPLTQNKGDDSMRSESTHVHSYAIPPSSSQVKSRTQRKQDAIAPYQTIIYHDNGSSRSSSSESRPVSYSSVSHTIGEVKSWREFDKTNNVNSKLNTTTSSSTNFNLPKVYSEPSKIYSEPSKFYSEPSKVYSEPSKIYSEPAKVYGQPEKIYSEPSKVYSQPSKIYSEPSKIYSEPAKVYGEPSKVYSEPARVYFDSTIPTTPMPSTTSQTRKIIFNLDRLPYDLLNAPAEGVEKTPINRPGEKIQLEKSNENIFEFKKSSETLNKPEIVLLDKDYDDNDVLTTTTLPTPVTSNSFEMFLPTQEQNYEVDEAVSVMTNGRHHGIQSNLPTPNPNDDSQKVGYVLEGRNYRKYRVEEKTPDGFIVGEYGIVSHNDGSLRGVRYTADSDTNPKLIYDALIKFLSL